MAQMVKNPLAVQEIQAQEDPLEKEMETHSSILCLGDPRHRGAWQVIVLGVAESDTTE